VVHRTPGAGDSPVILQTLRDQLNTKIFPVHRLDRGTSGCLAFAFSSEAAKKLQASLQAETSVKKYMALCLGELAAEGVIDRPLTNENKTKQIAVTKYKLLEIIKDYSLLELQILTGRKHQIRRHLSFLGHHIIGDVNHGKGWLNRKFREEYKFHRLFLHCNELSFLHPFTNDIVQIELGLAEELNHLLGQLKLTCEQVDTA